MSETEMRIREELAKEVEKDIEDEIKEGIYKLALRLHHLYRQQNERRKKQAGKQQKLCSELKIIIKMEGGTNIEFREMKREMADPEKVKLLVGAPRAVSYRSSNDGFVRPKKFDWTQTLRSRDGAVRPPVNKNKKAFIC